MEITEIQKTFILHWGEMGCKWGINRAMAQIHALLLVSEKPLNAQDISEGLNLARSNVSTGLRDLQAWKIIKLIHLMGDRREHYEADKDVWNVLSLIAERRIDQEIAPTIEVLKSLQANKSSSASQKQVFGDFIDIFENSISFFRKIQKLPVKLIRKLWKTPRFF